jgi:hypothetical protein
VPPNATLKFDVELLDIELEVKKVETSVNNNNVKYKRARKDTPITGD